MNDASTPLDPEQHRAAFWQIFTESSIPMALVDRGRRYVKINDAVVNLYQYPRDEVIGQLAGRTAVNDASKGELEWERLLRTHELYGERVVTHANGAHMRVSYAAHAMTLDDRWLALFVTLSARFQPDGPDLIGSAQMTPGNRGAKLTRREREVVRLVALGSDTREIASRLGVSSETIRTHVRNAMAKTGARTRAHLVALVIANELVEED
jgi:DNA-binding CsgD family transcriptional regulator